MKKTNNNETDVLFLVEVGLLFALLLHLATLLSSRLLFFHSANSLSFFSFLLFSPLSSPPDGLVRAAASGNWVAGCSEARPSSSARAADGEPVPRIGDGGDGAFLSMPNIESIIFLSRPNYFLLFAFIFFLPLSVCFRIFVSSLTLTRSISTY